MTERSTNAVILAVACLAHAAGLISMSRSTRLSSPLPSASSSGIPLQIIYKAATTVRWSPSPVVSPSNVPVGLSCGSIKPLILGFMRCGDGAIPLRSSPTCLLWLLLVAMIACVLSVAAGSLVLVGSLKAAIAVNSRCKLLQYPEVEGLREMLALREAEHGREMEEKETLIGAHLERINVLGEVEVRLRELEEQQLEEEKRFEKTLVSLEETTEKLEENSSQLVEQSSQHEDELAALREAYEAELASLREDQGEEEVREEEEEEVKREEEVEEEIKEEKKVEGSSHHLEAPERSRPPPSKKTLARRMRTSKQRERKRLEMEGAPSTE